MPASVRSFEAIQRVQAEVKRFGDRVGDGLVELEGEVRRMIDWVEHDRPLYWKERVRRAYDAVGEARGALHRCLMYPINDEQPSCVEERAALKKAEAHLVYCREKQELVRTIANQLRHELHEYVGRTSPLKDAIETEGPKAAATLGRMIDVLESYARGRAGGDTPTPSPTGTEGPSS
ncbi:MAG: hypothetical protein AAFV43_09215 [Planctomycetota bacterium]